MRKTFLALMVVGLPALIIYGALEHLPAFIRAQQESPESSVLNKEFKDIYTTDTSSKKVKGSKDQIDDFFYRGIEVEESVSKNTEFYTVKADTPWELREKILASAPENTTTERKSIVKVSYSVDWTLSTTQLAGECKFNGAKLNTVITMTLPLWEGVEMQDESVQKQWQYYLERVSHYESRHNKILERASHQLAQKIKFIPKQALCEDLLEKVNELGANNIEYTKNLVKRYKSETGGGRLLGVQLPTFSPDELARFAN